MLKTYRYRLYLTKRQIRLLDEQLEECRWLWNTLLAARKQAWEEQREAVDYYDQKAELPALQAGERPALKEVHSQVLQDVVLRLRTAVAAFFRRLQAGEDPGYPRFKGRGRYDSLTYPQWGNGVKLTANQQRLTLSKIGDVKIIHHRPLEGMPKTATIRRTATGKRFVAIVCEWDPVPLPPTHHEVGIDVGLHTFATCSDTAAITNPRFFREEEKAVLQNLPFYAEAYDVFGSCFTGVSCTAASRRRPALASPQAFSLSGELPASLLKLLAALRSRSRT